MEVTQLLDGQSPQMILMILMFISFAMLVVMFFLLVRIADDLRKTVRGVAGPMHDQMGMVREQLEDLIRVQYEILNAIEPQGGNRSRQEKAQSGKNGGKPASAAEPGDLLQGNITDFILDE